MERIIYKKGNTHNLLNRRILTIGDCPNIPKENLRNFKRGDIVYAKLSGLGYESYGTVPVLIIQNNIGNRFSPTLIVAPLHNRIKYYPTHYKLKELLEENSHLDTVCFEQLRVIDKCRIFNNTPIAYIDPKEWENNLIAAFGILEEDLMKTVNLKNRFDLDYYVDTDIEYPDIPKNLLRDFKTGDIVYVKLDGVGSEQQGFRPVLIVQNNKGNFSSNTLLVVPITTKNKTKIPTHYYIDNVQEVGLESRSTICFEQVKVIDKCRLFSTKPIGHINTQEWSSTLLTAFGISKSKIAC